MTEYAPVSVGADPPIGTAGTIVGTDPLETKDGDTSYTETTLASSGSIPSTVSFRLPSGALASPSARVWVSVESRRLTDYGGLVIYAQPPGALGGVGIVASALDFADTYSTVTFEVDFSSLPAWMGPAYIINPGTVFWVANSTGSGDTGTVRTTWLRIIVEGTPPLRQRNRDTIRQRNKGSRQRGIRQRGYL